REPGRVAGQASQRYVGVGLGALALKGRAVSGCPPATKLPVSALGRSDSPLFHYFVPPVARAAARHRSCTENFAPKSGAQSLVSWVNQNIGSTAMSVSLKQIRYFVAAAETGRISQ